MTDQERDERGRDPLEATETREWLESLDYVLASGGPERVHGLLADLQVHARKAGVALPFTANTPYMNTIPREPGAPLPRQPRDRAAHQEHHPLERHGDGGPRQPGGARHRRPHLHLCLGRHPLRGRLQPLLPRQGRTSYDGDQVYFQGHASPGIYARAFLEGRLTRGAAATTSAASWPRAAASPPTRTPG